MVIDSGTKHRRHWFRRRERCLGCGQVWPCFVVLLHRSHR